MNTTDTYSDIIPQIRAGDMALLDKIFTDNRNAFISQIIKQHHCPMEEAKDMYAVAVTIFYDNIMSGKLTTLTVKPLSYLLGIGQNLVNDWLRKQKDKPVDPQKILLHHITEEEVIPDTYEQKLKLVIQTMEVLGSACRAILELFYFEKRSIPEITSLLNFANVNTTKSRKYKCNQRLKKLVNDQWQKITNYA